MHSQCVQSSHIDTINIHTHAYESLPSRHARVCAFLLKNRHTDIPQIRTHASMHTGAQPNTQTDINCGACTRGRRRSRRRRTAVARSVSAWSLWSAVASTHARQYRQRTSSSSPEYNAKPQIKSTSRTQIVRLRLRQQRTHTHTRVRIAQFCCVFGVIVHARLCQFRSRFTRRTFRGKKRSRNCLF